MEQVQVELSLVFVFLDAGGAGTVPLCALGTSDKRWRPAQTQGGQGGEGYSPRAGAGVRKLWRLFLVCAPVLSSRSGFCIVDGIRGVSADLFGGLIVLRYRRSIVRACGRGCSDRGDDTSSESPRKKS